MDTLFYCSKEEAEPTCPEHHTVLIPKYLDKEENGRFFAIGECPDCRKEYKAYFDRTEGDNS